MTWSVLFFINSVLLGIGLAMDAFSVSIANGLGEPGMRRRRMCVIAGTFAFFQFIMPLAGWVCVRAAAARFSLFERFVPAVALVLLVYIGVKMIVEAVKGKGSAVKDAGSSGAAPIAGGGYWTLIVQGIATSIDALSVGFGITEYGLVMALVCALIIAVVTFVICMAGLKIGKTAGNVFSGKAEIAGGIILIGIGCEIFIKGYFF